MKNWIVIFIYVLIGIYSSYAQVNNYDLLMPAINPLYADSVFPMINLPPLNPYVPTLGNGTTTTASGSRANAFIAVTDLPDVDIFQWPEPHTEPHLTINKKYPNNIIISCNYHYQVVLSTIPPYYGSFRHDQTTFINNNFNNTPWARIPFFPPGLTYAWGDPSTTVDAGGNIFTATINSNANDFILDKSTDLGSTWLSPSPTWLPLGGNTQGAQSKDFDKEMIASDNLPSSPCVNNLYCVWMNVDDWICPAYPMRVMFNRLDVVNSATDFSYPPQILSPRYGQGANVQTSRDGHVFICWADYNDWPCFVPHGSLFHGAVNIGFAVSSDCGQSFLPDPADPNYLQKLYPISYTGIRTKIDAHPLYNNTKVNDFPAMAVDRSCGGSHSKRIYITYPELIPSTSSTSRIVVQYSDNEGATWYKANQTFNSDGIVDNGGALNWMPWITVDDATGNVYVAYLLAQSIASNGIFPTDVFLAYSDDGGVTFNNIKVSDHSFTPVAFPSGGTSPNGPFQEGYWGDYISVDAYGGNVYVAWMDNLNASPTYKWQYNIFCSTITVSSPLTYSSITDLPINGPLAMSNTQSSILYEASNSIIAAANQEDISILSSADVTLRAGNFIHLKTGSPTNSFSSLSGSKTHLYIANIPTCTTPYRRGNISLNADEKEKNNSNNLIVYPNPIHNDFSLDYSVYSDSKVTINLFDSFGRKVLIVLNNQFTINGKYTINVNLNSFNSGMYYLTLIMDNISCTKKIIKL